MGAFCPLCGSALPLPVARSVTVRCYTCQREHGLDVYGDMKVEYTLLFNPLETPKEASERMATKSTKKELDGPVVQRKCNNCGNNKMSYATLQLRSADEGQTVFYTCTKCRFKETENS